LLFNRKPSIPQLRLKLEIIQNLTHQNLTAVKVHWSDEKWLMRSFQWFALIFSGTTKHGGDKSDLLGRDVLKIGVEKKVTDHDVGEGSSIELGHGLRNEGVAYLII
jgi:hypothetical protein